MRASAVRKQTGEILVRLDRAEQGGDAEAAQKAYEDLFSVCVENHLDLNTVLRQRRPNNHGLRGALKALWPTSW
jgi:hypothetical protein